VVPYLDKGMHRIQPAFGFYKTVAIGYEVVPGCRCINRTNGLNNVLAIEELLPAILL